MNTIGFFRRDGDGFAGRLTSLSVDAAARIVPAEKFSAKAPDFVVLKDQAECGVGWKVTDNSGAILSLKLDDPAWPEPINARLLAAEDGELPLTWIRRVDPPADRPPPPTQPT